MGVLAMAVAGAAIGSASTAALAAGRASGTVGAFTRGCRGRAQSISSNGRVLGTMVAPGAPSANDPLLVDPSGTVRYSGATNGVITDYTWQLRVWGIRIVGGSGSNSGGERLAAGVKRMSQVLGPHLLTGVFPLSGFMRGNGGTCEGNVFIEVTGNPVGTPGWMAGAALSVIGVAGLFWSFPQRRR